MLYKCSPFTINQRGPPPSTDKLGLSPEDPRWIGAWWAGFLLCGALLFFSALLMFGFPQSLPLQDGGQESEQAMLSPAGLNTEYQMPKPSSNGAAGHHEPANSATCCQQLRGDAHTGFICSPSGRGD